MKKLFLFGLMISFLLLNGCGEEEVSDNGLTVSVGGLPVLIPSSGNGCVRPDNTYETVSDSYFSITSLNISWSKVDYDLQIAFITVEATGSGLSSKFSTSLDADDVSEKLVYLVGTAATPITNGTIPGPTTAGTVVQVQPKFSCSLKLGGVSIADKTKNFTLNATMTIQGIAVGNRATVGATAGNLGEEIPVVAKDKFTIRFDQN